MELLSKVSSQHKEWVKIVTTFGSDYPEDVVQEMYIRVHKYGQKEKVLNESGEVNLFYIWTLLRNCWHDSNKLNKLEFISIECLHTLSSEIDQVEKHEAFHKIETLIEEETKTWHHYDRMLFDIYRKKTLSMRDIAKETNISLTSIFNTLKNCKERIKENVGEDYEDYLHDEFELIR
jgi:DNA-directed RNA polymerase specialized sigma24 family protein